MPNKKLTKVLFFTNGLVGLGGQERVLLEAASYFQQQKKIITSVATFLLHQDLLQKYNHLTITELSSSSYFQRVKLLRQYLKQNTPQLVICSSSLDCMYMYLASFGLGIPYISYIHGSLFWLENEELKYALMHKNCFDRIRNSIQGHKEFVPEKIEISFTKKMFNNIVAILDYIAVKRARSIIVLTKQIAWEVEELYNKQSIIVRGCLDNWLFNYKHIIDVREKYHIDKKTKIIMNIGRLDPRKRIDVLIKAFDRFVGTSKNKDIVLLIGGKGPDKERLETIYTTLKNKEKIKFLGFIPDNEYYDHLAGCDVFVFPSWTTSGIPPYEALALGKKVVWTTEAEEPVLTHPLVFLADPTVEAFAQAIQKALTTTVKEKPPAYLKNQTWGTYFETLYGIALKTV